MPSLSSVLLLLFLVILLFFFQASKRDIHTNIKKQNQIILKSLGYMGINNTTNARNFCSFLHFFALNTFSQLLLYCYASNDMIKLCTEKAHCQ